MSDVNSGQQAVAIIDSVTKAIDAATPDTVVHTQPDPNYWWLLLIGIFPVFIAWWLNKKRKKKNE